MVRGAGSWGVTSPQVLQAMGQVERHRFGTAPWATKPMKTPVCPSVWGQTISKPSIVARMCESVARRRSRTHGRAGEGAGNR